MPEAGIDCTEHKFLIKVGVRTGYLAHYIQQGNAEEAAPIAAELRASLREWEAYA